MAENKGQKRRFLREKQRNALEKLLGTSVLHLEEKELGILYQLADELEDDVSKLERIEDFLDRREGQERKRAEFDEIKKALRQAGAQRDNDPLSGGMARVESSPSAESDPDTPEEGREDSDEEPPLSFSIDEEFEQPIPTAPKQASTPEVDKQSTPHAATGQTEPPSSAPPGAQDVAGEQPEKSEASQEKPEPTHPSRKDEPVKLVEKYIRCWNSKAFGVEYDCFEPNRMGINKETYMDRRMATWLVSNREELTVTQELGNVLKVHVTAGKARVLCTRIWNDHGKQAVYLELYELRPHDNEWRIHTVETGVATDDLLVKHLARV